MGAADRCFELFERESIDGAHGSGLWEQQKDKQLICQHRGRG